MKAAPKKRAVPKKSSKPPQAWSGLRLSMKKPPPEIQTAASRFEGRTLGGEREQSVD
jgi:hypothetical protein